MINIRVVHRQVTEISSELLLGLIFEESRPPKKTLGEIDWFLNGLISRMVINGQLHLGYGKLNLIASQLKIVAPKVLLVGMGSRKDFKIEMLKESFSNLSSAISDLKVNNVAFIPPDPFDTSEERQDIIFKEAISGIIQGSENTKEEFWFSLIATGTKNAALIRSSVEEMLQSYEGATLMPS